MAGMRLVLPPEMEGEVNWKFLFSKKIEDALGGSSIEGIRKEARIAWDDGKRRRITDADNAADGGKYFMAEGSDSWYYARLKDGVLKVYVGEEVGGAADKKKEGAENKPDENRGESGLRESARPDLASGRRTQLIANAEIFALKGAEEGSPVISYIEYLPNERMSIYFSSLPNRMLYPQDLGPAITDYLGTPEGRRSTIEWLQMRLAGWYTEHGVAGYYALTDEERRGIDRRLAGTEVVVSSNWFTIPGVTQKLGGDRFGITLSPLQMPLPHEILHAVSDCDSQNDLPPQYEHKLEEGMTDILSQCNCYPQLRARMNSYIDSLPREDRKKAMDAMVREWLNEPARSQGYLEGLLDGMLRNVNGVH